MLQFIKLHAPLQLRQTAKQHDVPQTQRIPTCTSPSILKQCSKFSRREVTLFTNSSLLLLLTSQTLELLPRVRAEEEPRETSAEDDQQGAESTAERADENPQEISADSTSTQVDENPQEISAENDQQEAESTVKRADESSQETSAENDQPEAESGPKDASGGSDKTLTNRAFLDVSIDGKPAGRIVIGLYRETAPVGAARFSDIVSGRAGISYRRKDFVKIMPNYVQHGGVRSYGVDAELAAKTGRSLTNERLIQEWEGLNEREGTKNVAGSISIIVRDPLKPPPKMKLVARKGKLEIDQEEIGVEPNGTEFTIAARDSPELDSSALVIGKVIDGMGVVEKIGQVKTVQENTSSPYFRAAKLIGDKRAVVAERGFNRPYSKVTITNCGLLE